ncbi:MAG: outer membrane beta-barrel family protein [Alistipes sp.]|nr:outer membrane beta-barrel family protein [Alistipes sp.]
MKRVYLVALLLAATAGALTAQSQRRSTVSGVVADATTRQSLIGVIVELMPVADSTRSSIVVSGAGGAFSTGLDRGKHMVKASMMGYETLRRPIDVTEARQSLDTLFISQGIHIDAVAVSAVAMRTSMAGDTLIYSADAYRVASDATVEGLLSKMPGIRVDGGTVEAQGEAVRRILIDNREFFGEDVAAAISSIPAEAVKNIEVFDRLSDNAEFTGIDDGEGYKAINITTRESMRQGVMGQVSSLYGVEPPERDGEKWHHVGLLGANVNVFHGDAKLTLGGTLNNLNERHFTSQDILGAGDDGGIARVGMFRVNYADALGKRNQWRMDASYAYNVTDAETNTSVEREYFETEDALYRNYSSTSRRSTLTNQHVFDGRIDFRPNPYHELRIRPFFRYMGRDASGESGETYIPVDESGKIDLTNWSNSDETGYMFGVRTNYRVRLGKPGRTLSVFFNTSYDPDDITGESYSERQDLNPDGSNVYIRQSTPEFNYSFDIGGGLTYTEPLGKGSLVNFDYSVNYSYSDQDLKSYLWDNELELYAENPDIDLSGVYNSGYLTHRAGPGYRMQKGNTTLSAGVFYQYSTLESSRVLPREYELTHGFDNVTYSVMLNSQFTSGASIRLFLNSRTRNPGILDLQDVVDISNVQDITKGNLNLNPSYGHMFYGRFIIPNVQKGRTLSINMGANYTTDAIVRRTIRESPGYAIVDSDGNQMTNPADGTPLTLDGVGTYNERINMDGQWSARMGVDYGFPVKFLHSNLNVEASVDYGESPSQYGRWAPGMDAPRYETNIQSSLSPEAEVTLGSNISERVDFRLSYEIGYNRVRNSFFTRSDNEYIEQEIDASFKFVLPADFTFAGNVSYVNDASLVGQSFRQEFMIANAAVGKKIFRSRLGEISVLVNDIFNQNVSFRRRAEALYIQNQTSSAIGRYVGLKFTWNIRHFGRHGSQNLDMYEIDTDHHDHNH